MDYEWDMTKADTNFKKHPDLNDENDLAAEYIFDYTKAKPNRFAPKDSRSEMG
jgi:uncharacterized DUF497 family protein